MSTPLDLALYYASRGWRVFPLPAGQKTPFPTSILSDPEGRGGFYVATVDETTIRQWWGRWPDANIGIATGKESNLVALDVDAGHGGETSLLTLRTDWGNEFIDTVQSLTGGGGRHILYTYPGEIHNSAGELGKGLDIRADGGYIVAPPSLHPNGKKYQWDMANLPSQTILADMPEWMYKRLAEKTTEGAPHQPAAAYAERIEQGGRNHAIASLAGTMRRRGMSYDSVLAGLLIENATKCNPPLSADEVSRIAKSVCRYAPTAPPTNPNPPEEIEQDGQTFQMRQAMTAEQVGKSFLELIDNLHGRSIPTFISPIDRALGGLERQSLSILAARPSMGKTTLAWQIGRLAALGGIRVLFLSQEMSAASLWAKAVCGSLGIRWKDLRAAGGADDDTRAKIINRTDELISSYGANLLIDDGPQTMRSAEHLISTLRPDLVIHDHLRLIHVEKVDNMREDQRLGFISAKAKELAKTYNLHWMQLAQLNRSAEAREDKRPTLSDLRDSGQIEENADTVLMIYRDDYYATGEKPATTMTELLVRKFRDDIMDSRITLDFHAAYQWFSAVGEQAEY